MQIFLAKIEDKKHESVSVIAEKPSPAMVYILAYNMTKTTGEYLHSICSAVSHS